MALTALSNGVVIPTKLQDIGISANVACAIVRIPSSRLSLCASGVRDLDPEGAKGLHELLNKLTRLQKAIPFPLSFKDAERWRTVLKWMEEESVSVEDVEASMEQLFGRMGQQ